VIAEAGAIITAMSAMAAASDAKRDLGLRDRYMGSPLQGASVRRVGSSLAGKDGIVEQRRREGLPFTTQMVRLSTASAWVESTPEGTIRT
jgi:hypothetical protein